MSGRVCSLVAVMTEQWHPPSRALSWGVCPNVLCCRRTRKAAADAASDLTSRQAALADMTAQVSSKQVSLEGIEASLAAKSKELQEVLAQLQAAAAQEFQDAKKLLLEEGEAQPRPHFLPHVPHRDG